MKIAVEVTPLFLFPKTAYTYIMEMKLDFDQKKLQRGFVDIQKANVIATRNTLNTMAALTRRNSVNNLHSEFINRNTFTKRQIQFDKTTSEKISSMEAVTGATEKASYMALQEDGGINKPIKGGNLAIAHNRARGGSRTSLVRKANYQRKIKSKSVRGKFKKNFKSRKAMMVARAYVAKKENKFIKTNSGVFDVSTFKKSKTRIKFRKNMIYNTKERSVRIQSTPWLSPATKKPIQDGQAIYNSQINKLLKMDVI